MNHRPSQSRGGTKQAPDLPSRLTDLFHTAERYKIAGHSALVVQAGTISTRRRGEANSFNVLRLERPHITVARRTWDDGPQTFVEASVRKFQHTDRGWIEEGVA